MRKNLRASDLLKKERIIKGNTDETLSQALPKLRSSHDAVFVFNNKDRFEGVINPYYVMFKSKFPPETKLAHCLFSPPRLDLQTPIFEIAKLMVESKVYFLPVFDKKNKFVGIVSANRIFGKALKDKKLTASLDLRRRKNIHCILSKVTLAEAYSLMKKRGVSRLPVVNEYGHLVGIVTRHDLRKISQAPKQKQRFLSRSGDKRKFLDKPISSFYKKMVATLDAKSENYQILSTMLDKGIGSVVMIDKKRRPVGLVSNRDVLNALASLKRKRRSNIEVKISDEFQHSKSARKIFNKFYKKYDKIYSFQKTEFILAISKNRAGEPSKYNVSLLFILGDGREAVSEVTDYKWRVALRSALKKAASQLRRE